MGKTGVFMVGISRGEIPVVLWSGVLHFRYNYIKCVRVTLGEIKKIFY